MHDISGSDMVLCCGILCDFGLVLRQSWYHDGLD